MRSTKIQLGLCGQLLHRQVFTSAMGGFIGEIREKYGDEKYREIRGQTDSLIDIEVKADSIVNVTGKLER